MDDLKFKMLDLAARLAESEFDRSWRLYGHVLTVNAALIVILAFSHKNQQYELTTVVSLAGLVIAVIWRLLTGNHRFYAQRWVKDMTAIIDDDPELGKSLRSRSSGGPRMEKGIKRPWRSSTTYMRSIVVVVFAMWCCILAASLLLPESPQQEKHDETSSSAMPGE